MRNSHGFKKFGWMLLVPCGLAIASLVVPPVATAQRPSKSAGGKKDDAGQQPAGKKGEAAKRDSGAKRGDEEDKTKPQAVDLETSDGVLIAATYFPPRGREAPVVMLLHGYGEKQSIFWPTGTGKDLAFALQDKGYAVLTFDFRGHGHSTSRSSVNGTTVQKGAATGGKLDFNDIRTPAQLLNLRNDIEAAKRFLVRRNNAGELNLSKLAVVGCEMGATLGVLLSFRDWQFPVQAGFSGKQGQDVLALVLISPQYNFRGISIAKELAYLQQRLPIQVIVGEKDAKAFGEGDKMHKAAQRARPADSDSRLTRLNTKLQGSKLLNPDFELDAEKEIVAFLDNTLKKKAAKWEKREITDGEASKNP